MSDFSGLGLRDALVENLVSLGYVEMTPVQELALPEILAGKDVLAQAKTGSGKTAAFGLGILQGVDVAVARMQALVLCPTRELAEQVAGEIRRLARGLANTRVLTLCGGVPLGPQKVSLQRSPHIVVGTPGRVLKHLGVKSLKLGGLGVLVLDEADRMLDMGFQEDILRVIKALPSKRQTLLFSATYPEGIGKISRSIQVDPVDVLVETSYENVHIKQVFYEVEELSRVDSLVGVLRHYAPVSAVVFCNRKMQCVELVEELSRAEISCLSLHGDLEQVEREEVLVRFANRSCSVLIATDVAARGLDIKDLGLVVNYELSRDPEVHVHRVGRTGRAGSGGLAVSFFMAAEQYLVEAIGAFQGSVAKVGKVSSLKAQGEYVGLAPMVTLCVSGGRRDKVRAGDLLGALTGSGEIAGAQVGKINIGERFSYVAVERGVSKAALEMLQVGRVKGRSFRVRLLR